MFDVCGVTEGKINEEHKMRYLKTRKNKYLELLSHGGGGRGDNVKVTNKRLLNQGKSENS